MNRRLSHMLNRRDESRQARLQNIQHGRHMIGQYDEIEMLERTAVDAFRFSYARGGHWNVLSDSRNVLMLAACHKIETSTVKADHEAVREVTRIALEALKSIRDREQKTGKFGCNAAELNALHALVETSRDFWNRQPAELFQNALDANAKVTKDLVRERRTQG
ncbi:hypothetical protein U5817_09790 [Aromatoleum evansii]|uniref:Uncharacterized protein n=1 Tax=Aromatoleum evansii TaxID=59406 RepID=A0ABZ1AR14_AROEV|nr:hypothetical protein U5817_09440 [Aromatoleum evansii]WRL48317.1 hypothetical protein U5817_09790 [Aromatoleum evansii]